MVDKDKDKSRQRWLSEIASKISGALLPNGGDLRRLHEAWIGRWQALVEAWGATENGNHPTLFTAKSSGRVIVGLGGPSPLDTDMTLHHVYGLPYLPGSALKGLTHAYAEHTGQSEDDIKRIFGTTNGGGAVIFFDAIPGVGLTIDLDIMNPHYPDYYQDTGNQTPPSDDQSPIPIFFLTVKNSAFHFAVAPRPGAPEKAASAGQTGDREKSDAEIAACWLRDALEHEGIGGKTSSGYGRFEETKRT
ncbi:MAG TPA: type III-B CRISPR module RAMP protein Cmr6 [Ktedonobacterales bacterium]|nr:type III-B CRISPR module RAMP protein Cmr6 [Ktedonobacterales bacterium]